MSLLAKYNCGKRMNLIQRGSFQMRTYLAALHYNTGKYYILHFHRINSTCNIIRLIMAVGCL